MLSPCLYWICNYFPNYSNSTAFQGNRTATFISCPTQCSNHRNKKKKKRFTKECGSHLSAGRRRGWIRTLQCCCSSWSPERDSIFTKPGWETPPFSMFWHPCWPKQGFFVGSFAAFGFGCWNNTLLMARASRCSASFLGRTASADGFSWKGHHWVYWTLARFLYFLKAALDMLC